MIISRSPFRITLAGGGTDLPAFYKKHGGLVTSMAIDKHIYVSFKKNLLDENIRLQYLKTEYVKSTEELEHRRAREVLRHYGILKGCEISSMADLPAKSGLGSSGSYLVSLINCIQEHQGCFLSKHEMADLACSIEMEKLLEPVGKQDQFIAAYGGIRTFVIDKTGSVSVKSIQMNRQNVADFVDRCRIYYTGCQRDASEILKSQTVDKINFEEKMLRIHDLGYRFVEALEEQNYDRYGELLDEHWKYKKSLSSKMSNGVIDKAYDSLKSDGRILGGKIIGAGGGGFLMVYVPQEFDKVDRYLSNYGFRHLKYSLDTTGVKKIVG
jgi:D-glycero-alpha-D-manno-heptose-7-phosphate kinase